MENQTPLNQNEPDERPLAIAILAATTVELLPTVRALNLKAAGPLMYLGVGESVRVVAKVTGIGPTNAAAALIRLLDLERVASIIHVGFAGGLERGLPAGELMDIRWLISPDNSPLWIGDGVPIPANNLNERTPQRSLLSVDRVVESVVAKRRLYEKHLAASVDMESYELARVAGQMKLPYRAVRAISDPWDMALPREAERWVTPDGRPAAGAVAGDLLRHPSWLGTVLSLRRNAKAAATAVADRTRQIVSGEARALERSEGRK